MRAIWGRVRTRAVVRRARNVAFETMEGRALLSSVVVDHPAVTAEVAARKAERAEKVEARHEAVQKRQAAEYAQQINGKATVAGRLNFLVNTISTAHKLVHSPNLVNVAADFTKLTFSHDTRKVAGEYIKDLFNGSGQSLDDLGHTKLVTNVGKEFTALSHSPDIKKISRSFTHFGDAVAKQFNHLFGL